MVVEYERNLNKSYMIFKEAEYPYENTELLMLLNNEIPGLLKLQVIISNGNMEYWYDITGTTSLGTRMDALSLDSAALRRLIEDIYDMNRQLEDFMLDGENVCYEPKWLYYDRAAGKYCFCYLPGSKTLNQNSLQSLAEYLLTKIDYKDPDAVAMGYAFYEKSMQESCSIKELLACTKITGNQPSQKNNPVGNTLPIEETKETEYMEVNDKKFFRSRKEKKNRKKTPKKNSLGYEDRMNVLKRPAIVAETSGRSNQRELFNLEKRIELGKLIYQGDGKEENFVLEDDVFLIGKEADVVNGLLHSDQVSRVHARIYRQDGNYYIEDLNSAMGTFVNGKQILYREPLKLEHLDRIVFGFEEFLFSI